MVEGEWCLQSGYVLMGREEVILYLLVLPSSVFAISA